MGSDHSVTNLKIKKSIEIYFLVVFFKSHNKLQDIDNCCRAGAASFWWNEAESAGSVFDFLAKEDLHKCHKLQPFLTSSIHIYNK
jgi:hypothetical protein